MNLEGAETIKDVLEIHRKDIQDTADLVLRLMNHNFELPESANSGEMKANIMLAYRHLEDARMRLGKVIQAHDGGVSVYDQPK